MLAIALAVLVLRGPLLGPHWKAARGWRRTRKFSASRGTQSDSGWEETQVGKSADRLCLARGSFDDNNIPKKELHRSPWVGPSNAI